MESYRTWTTYERAKFFLVDGQVIVMILSFWTGRSGQIAKTGFVSGSIVGQIIAWLTPMFKFKDNWGKPFPLSKFLRIFMVIVFLRDPLLLSCILDWLGCK